MPRNFDDLADRVKASWSDDTHRVYEAAATEFVAEVDDRSQLGAQFAAARKARELSQPALSAMTGIHPSYISHIESGRGNPTAATLVRLAEALGQRILLVPDEESQRRTGSPRERGESARRLAELPGLDWRVDRAFVDWLDDKGWADRLLDVVTNLRRYFPDETLRIEAADPDEDPGIVLITVRTKDDQFEAADEALDRFDEEWLHHQPIGLVVKISVHLE